MLSKYDVLIEPVMTEKSMNTKKEGVYTFKVASEATKPYIKKAVEEIFGVEVLKVNVHNRPGKTRRFRGITGQRSDVRFAVVTLKSGTINFEGGF